MSHSRPDPPPPPPYSCHSSSILEQTNICTRTTGIARTDDKWRHKLSNSGGCVHWAFVIRVIQFVWTDRAPLVATRRTNYREPKTFDIRPAPLTSYQRLVFRYLGDGSSKPALEGGAAGEVEEKEEEKRRKGRGERENERGTLDVYTTTATTHEQPHTHSHTHNLTPFACTHLYAQVWIAINNLSSVGEINIGNGRGLPGPWNDTAGC